MRTARKKPILQNQLSLYWVESKIARQRPLLQAAEQHALLRILRTSASFAGVHVLGWAMSPTRVRLVLQIPSPPSLPLNDDELLARCAHIYSPAELRAIQRKLSHFPSQSAKGQNYRNEFFRQMWDLAFFMKRVKHRFARWYNRTRPTPIKGSIWGQRFQSEPLRSGWEVEGPSALPEGGSPVDLGDFLMQDACFERVANLI